MVEEHCLNSEFCFRNTNLGYKYIEKTQISQSPQGERRQKSVALVEQGALNKIIK